MAIVSRFDHLAGERDRVTAEIAGACGGAAARLHNITPHTPHRLRCHDAPPLSVLPADRRGARTSADQQQAQALGNIFSGQAGGWPAVLASLIGNLLASKQVPIRFETIDGEHRITVPGLLEVGSEQVPNPLSGQPPLDPKVSDLAVPFYTGAARVRRSRTLRPTDPNMAFEYSGRSALIGSFDYSGP